jgi:hypothetical protein
MGRSRKPLWGSSPPWVRIPPSPQLLNPMPELLAPARMGRNAIVGCRATKAFSRTQAPSRTSRRSLFLSIGKSSSQRPGDQRCASKPWHLRAVQSKDLATRTLVGLPGLARRWRTSAKKRKDRGGQGDFIEPYLCSYADSYPVDQL